MIRRALTPILATLTLAATLTACTGGGGGGITGPSDADVAVDFMTAYITGDDAAACELATKPIGSCTKGPENGFTKEPEAVETFENEETGTTATIVDYTTVKDPDPASYAVEVNADGKVSEWAEMSGQPKNRATVVMVLGWSE